MNTKKIPKKSPINIYRCGMRMKKVKIIKVKSIKIFNKS